MKAFFCYEYDFAHRPCPVVYFDSRPGKGVDHNIRRSDVIELDESDASIFNHGEPLFGKLVEKYPPPELSL